MTGTWQRLVSLVDDMELLNAALTEVQEETLRRAAAQIRRNRSRAEEQLSNSREYLLGMNDGADLIDPDKGA